MYGIVSDDDEIEKYNMSWCYLLWLYLQVYDVKMYQEFSVVGCTLYSSVLWLFSIFLSRNVFCSYFSYMLKK